ncbi:hypothetical protein BS47DRAFT_895136 [Hydnum rufescens UP504]|uniref:Uncharacterized protein n=1 Tax=Hydnum rufescens UP504 TaxID=1448309 RepID=A0A9P6DFX0_9AGAM|nr:hypothetical protein BS47DRAFT_895136 [Hydnum rufescens UP504]
MHPLILIQRAAARKARTFPLLTVAQEDAQQQSYSQAPPQTPSSFSSSSSSLSPFHLDVSDSRASGPPMSYSPYSGPDEMSSLPFPDFPFESQVPETVFKSIPPNLNFHDEVNHALSGNYNPYAAPGFLPFPQSTQNLSLPVFTLTDPHHEDAEPACEKRCTDPAIHDALDQINRSPCGRCGKSEVITLGIFVLY